LTATPAGATLACPDPAGIHFTLSAKLEEAVTVTGTRIKGRTSTETLAPVDVIDGEAIRATGAVETGKILQLLEPSFNFSTTTISDGTDIIRPATLRSLNPDQVLVLVNGKRYHQQSLMNYQQTIARGSAGYDINSIPASAIDHIEVLRDGAAAQYGSDAIAGVINIIQGLVLGSERKLRPEQVQVPRGQHGQRELLLRAPRPEQP
jgi:iron complex outermembrane recepter protein